MLRELDVENLLLIESAGIRLGGGLNVLTGETGAGKTLLATAIGLLIGERSRSGLVRPGAECAVVTGRFSLPPDLDAEAAGLVPDGASEIELSRQVWPDGRSRARICGAVATVTDLRRISANLVRFHGQHEHRKLMLAGFQRSILDSFCGLRQAEALAALAQAHGLVCGIEQRLESLGSGGSGSQRELDLLRWELDEIEALAPDAEERAGLVGERARLRQADALREAAAACLAALSPEDDGPNGAGLAAAAASFGRLDAGDDPVIGSLTARLADLAAEGEDVAREVRLLLDGVDGSGKRLDEVEERLSAYELLERKHGGSVESVLAHADECRRRIADLGDVEAAIERAESDLDSAIAARLEAASVVTAGRRDGAGELAPKVEQELAELGLAGASFGIDLRELDEPGAEGAERVEFMVAPNPGIAPSSLSESASGGEISRVLLALLAVSNEGPHGVPVLVFDEIDAGIGGRTAVAVGERLASIASDRQVICITHLAPVAARAGSHFRIDKALVENGSVTTVEPLEGDALVGELVRMLGASEGDEAALEHARNLLSAGHSDGAD